MTTHHVVVAPWTDPGSAPAAPTADGAPFAWEMVTSTGHRVYAHTPAGLLNFFAPGYVTMPADQRRRCRWRIAVDAQVHVQAQENMTAAFTRLPVHAQLLLTGPRHVPLVVPSWPHPVAVVLITADYGPGTGRPFPQPDAGQPANVTWINPTSDAHLLRSLHEAGYWHVFRFEGVAA